MSTTISGTNGVTFPDSTSLSTTPPADKVKTWVNFSGIGTVAIRAGYNVSSITDIGTGQYTVNFTTELPDSNYSYSVNGVYLDWYTCFFARSYPSTTSLAIGVSDAYGGGGWKDAGTVVVTIFSN